MLKMAEIIERKICHPDEVILKKGAKAEFIILQKGKIDLVCRTSNPSSSLNGKVIEKLEVEDGEKPKVLSLDFIRNKSLDYDIKSDKYTILYSLSIENFQESLKGYEIDYQLFCTLRDKDGYILNEDQVYPCHACKGEYHNKFECSKLHYRPLKRMIISRFLKKMKKQKVKRRSMKRK